MLRIGTRGSELATWQANFVKERLREKGHEATIVVIRTTGDIRTDVPLSMIGGKGLFLKELEAALDDGAIDLAVHSLKDVPSILEERFELAAFVDRADPRDAWISITGDGWRGRNLRVIGSSSPRRRAQLLAIRRDANVQSIRGNVDSRIEKMRAGGYDAIVLAAAGLARLGRSSEVTAFFEPSEMTPAAGQGIIAVECLRGSETSALMASIDRIEVRREAEAERGVLQSFGTRLDCHSSVAVHAKSEKNGLVIDAFLSDPDARQVLRERRSCSFDEAGEVVREIGEALRSRGALELLARSAND